MLKSVTKKTVELVGEFTKKWKQIEKEMQYEPD